MKWGMYGVLRRYNVIVYNSPLYCIIVIHQHQTKIPNKYPLHASNMKRSNFDLDCDLFHGIHRHIGICGTQTHTHRIVFPFVENWFFMLLFSQIALFLYLSFYLSHTFFLSFSLSRSLVLSRFNHFRITQCGSEQWKKSDIPHTHWCLSTICIRTHLVRGIPPLNNFSQYNAHTLSLRMLLSIMWSIAKSLYSHSHTIHSSIHMNRNIFLFPFSIFRGLAQFLEANESSKQKTLNGNIENLIEI